MPKNWKYIKKLLEKEFLCEKLRGHITYDLTEYRPAPWYQQHFIMKYDDEFLLNVSQPERQWDKRYAGIATNRGQAVEISERLYQKHVLNQYSLPPDVVQTLVTDAIEEADKFDSHRRGVFGVHDIVDMIGVYLHSDIEQCLAFEQDDFIRALAILDRRCGKRRFKEYANRTYSSYPDWLKRIFQLRLDVEGIRYGSFYAVKTQIL